MQTALSPHLRSHLFSRFPRFTSRDADEVRHEVSQIFCEHDLRVVGRSQSLNTELHFRRGKKVSYGRMLYGATVDIEPGRLDDFYLIQLPISGQENVHCGAQSVLSDAGMATIISPALEFRMRHERNAEKLFIRVERSAFEQQCAQYYGRPAGGPLNFSPAIPLHSPATRSLKQLLEWQLTEASEGSLFDQPLIAAQFEEALMVSLLGTLPHNQDAAREPLGAIAPGFVKRAEAYIEHNAHLPLTAGDIADHVGVSMRSLFAGYRKYRSTSPMQQLKEIRLNAVRAELSGPRPDTTVTQTALRWGFCHLGQFSAAYQQRFSELPSATLKRSKG
ncbi:AraC family transcriptional regulator [Pusillimonas sp.]|uniref:AraC family transcriptional regulator n=1 Tax=Pusillimonas sp. TaxID=3040095 RepID=UPI0029AA469E|nr:helix-turn-helix domain-containing protein [Pusillimonas sp.]MDX3893828.1 helix-turn-helix domain-containing protein [Pusillimonas sp.]